MHHIIFSWPQWLNQNNILQRLYHHIPFHPCFSNPYISSVSFFCSSCSPFLFWLDNHISFLACVTTSPFYNLCSQTIMTILLRWRKRWYIKTIHYKSEHAGGGWRSEMESQYTRFWYMRDRIIEYCQQIFVSETLVISCYWYKH